MIYKNAFYRLLTFSLRAETAADESEAACGISAATWLVPSTDVVKADEVKAVSNMLTAKEGRGEKKQHSKIKSQK